MKKEYTVFRAAKTQSLIIGLVLCLLSNVVSAQIAGDYRTNKAAVAWETAADWDVYDGSAWSVASSAPTATTNVYIQSGHIAALAANGSCKDLNISTGNAGTVAAPTGTDGRVALQANTLELNGRISCYFGVVSPAGSLGATATTVVPGAPITITAASGGKLSVVGATRTITGSWGVASTGGTTLFPIEFNLTDNTQVATIGSGGIKAQSWDIKTGTVSTTARLHADPNAAAGGFGNFTIRTGATLASSVTGQAIVTQRATAAGGTFTLETGAKLKLTGAAPLLDMTTVVLDGTVEYNLATAGVTQSFLNTTATGVTPAGVSPATYSYKTVTLTTGNPRALVANTTITGLLTLNNNPLTVGANTLTLGGNSISKVNGYIDANDANAKIVFTNTAALTLPSNLFNNNNVNYLTINNSANVNLGGPLTVSNILDLSAGNITVGTHTLTIAGTMTKGTGFMTANGMATLAFTNPTEITLPAAFLTTNSYVGSLTVNGGGIILSSNLGFNNAITLTNGKITLGSSNLISNTNGVINGGSASSYIVTNGIGKLLQPHLAGINKTYPVGTATSYDPVTVEPTDATSISVSVQPAFDNAVGDAVKVATKQWDISSSTPSSTILTLTPSNPVATTTPVMGHYTASAWEELAATRSGDTWTATTTSFSPFGAGEVGGFAGAVPVELYQFQIKSTQKSAFLSWSTASEKNNAFFNIEQSTNGLDFQTIGQVKGNGTTSASNTYNFEHNTPSVGINYYRLKQVDFDGSSTLSKIISVQFGGKGNKVTVYPTMAFDKLNVQIDSDETMPYTIFDLQGNNVQTGQLTGQKELIISDLSSGMYILKVGNAVVKFVKNYL
jgi:Secretion system C-terminal sorting domain